MKISSKTDYIIPAFLGFLVLCAYPLAFCRVLSFNKLIANWSLLEGFTWEIIGYFALAAVIMRWRKLFDLLKEKPVILFGAAIYMLILAVQQVFIFKSFYYFGGGLSYITFIAAGYLYAKEWQKILLPMLWIFLLFSVIANFYDMKMDNQRAGFTGNWNWSATLTLITSGSIFFIFRKILPGFKRFWGIYFTGLIALAAVYLYFVANFPKGTIVAAFVGGIVLLWGYLDYFTNRKQRSMLYLLIFIILAGGAFFMRGRIAEMLKNDTRIYLWQNGFNVILFNPTAGCGYGRYISEAADKMPEKYFLTDNAAVIHNHPHNEFIYLIATFGIGGIVLCIWILYIFIKSMFLFERRRDFKNGYFLFIFTVLLMHSMVDVLLMHWPNGPIFNLLCGALVPMLKIHDNAVVPEINEQPEANVSEEDKTEKYPEFKYISAIICIIIGGYLLYMNLMASMYYRQSVNLGNNLKARADITRKSMQYRATYKTVNDAAVLSESAAEGLKLLCSMEEKTGIANFAHTNYQKAIFYLQVNDFQKAYESCLEEEKCFPYSIRNLYLLQNILDFTGEHKERDIVRKKIIDIIKLKSKTVKGLGTHHIGYLVENSAYDLNTGRMPQEILNIKPVKINKPSQK